MTAYLQSAWIALAVFGLHVVAAQEKKPNPIESAPPAAILKSPVGTLLVGDTPGKWKLPSLFDYVPAEKTLLALPGGRAVLDLPKAGARLVLWGNLPELSSSPVLESVGRLRTTKGFDVSLSWHRGRLMLENLRKDGPVTARFHLGKGHLDVTLNSPNSAIVLERFHRWAPGIPFEKKPEKPRAADAHLVLLVVKGKVETAHQGETHNVQEPVVFHGIGGGRLQGPSAIKKLPDWVTPSADPSEKTTAWHKAVESLRRQLAAKKSVDVALRAATGQQDSRTRAVAVYSDAAVGAWPMALEGWRDKSAEVRSASTRALQHQISRGSAADIKLYKVLLDAKHSAGQAQIIMELLHGFAGASLTRPETYEILINYLQHQQPAIRELAAWNLYALVPQGKSIPYDAAAAAEERARAQAAWHKLIPEGKLPPSDRN